MEKTKTCSCLSKMPCFQQKAFPVFVEGVGSTFVVMVSPRMEIEDLVEIVQTKLGLPSEAFFLSFLGRVLDSVRMKDLTRGLVYPCQFSVARWHDACSPRFAWSMDMRLLWDQPLLGHAQHLLQVRRGSWAHRRFTASLSKHGARGSRKRDVWCVHSCWLILHASTLGC